MYEDQTYEEILERSLARVTTGIDKREGSLVMNAIAPVSAEHANIYILLDSLIQNGYADTAIREYLVLRCRERGIAPYEATNAVLKGKFNKAVPTDSRFSLGELNYRIVELVGNDAEYIYYYLQCETAGTEGNKYFGELTPINFMIEGFEGEITEVITPARDEEETESLRSRYFNSFNSKPFGGNIQDYKEKTNALNGVGGTVVIPAWNGGGTVKLIIIDNTYNVASQGLVEAVQEAIDPTSSGSGTGIAPIGHKVTVVSAEAKPINISFSVTFNEGYTWNSMERAIKDAIEAYLLEMRQVWESGNLTVRISQIETRVLNLEGVIDVSNTTVNGVDTNLELSVEELPMLGGVVNG